MSIWILNIFNPMWHYLLFFLVTLFTLSYLYTFLQNRKNKVKFEFFNHTLEVSLGGLLLSVFLDGIIITVLVVYFFV